MMTLIRKTSLAFIGALMFFASVSAPASAHRVGIPLTTLEWHEPSGRWHLVHRLSSHDFAGQIPEIGDAGLDTREAQEGMARFILSHFQIRGTKDTVRFSYLGAEEDADSFWIYFELASTDQDIVIDNRLVLEDAENDPRRHALVNISAGEGVTSLLFTPADAPKQVRLERPSATATSP